MTTSCSCAAETVAFVRPVFKRWKWLQECFVVVPVNVKHVALCKPIVVGVGTASNVNVHPRDVFREAIKRNACGVLVCHNHPSGVLEWSLDDLCLTRRLKEAGELLGIPVLDHIILAKDGRFASLIALAS